MYQSASWPGRAGDAQDLASGELVGEGGREQRSADHCERLHLGDGHRVGPCRHLVVGRARAFVELEVDVAAVGLGEVLVELDETEQRLLVLRVGVVGGDGARDEVDHRVGLGAQVVDDLDRVGGDARVGRTTVVAGEHCEALRREEARIGELAARRVAPLTPIDLVGDPLRLCGAPVHDAFGQRAGRHRGARARRGGVIVVVASARDDRHDGDDGHHDHHPDDRAVPLPRVGSFRSARCRLHDSPFCAGVPVSCSVPLSGR